MWHGPWQSDTTPQEFVYSLGWKRQAMSNDQHLRCCLLLDEGMRCYICIYTPKPILQNEDQSWPLHLRGPEGRRQAELRESQSVGILGSGKWY